jgi:hypothetical protein
MRRSTPVLVVLLLASLLGNILLAVRLSRAGGDLPPARTTSATAEGTTSANDVASLREALAVERKKAEELNARIERLETDKKVLALETPGAAKTDRVAAFRDKLRKLKKLMADPALKSGAGVDPENMADLTDAMMEFMKLAAVRAKEPKLYADYLHAFYEVGLEGEGTSLTPAQSESLSAMLQQYGDDLSRVPAAPAGDRLLKDLQLEGAVMGKVQALFTDAQRAALKTEQFEAMSSMNFLSTAYVTKDGAADQIAQQWSAQYQLDPSQLQQAKATAQAYVDALARLDAAAKGIDPTINQPGSPEAYAYRESMVREQLAALATLQASMTPAQADRLRTQTMKEIHVVNGSAEAQVVTTPEK